MWQLTDVFGEKVVDGLSKLDIKIAPGKTAESDSYYLWEDIHSFPVSLMIVSTDQSRLVLVRLLCW